MRRLAPLGCAAVILLAMLVRQAADVSFGSAGGPVGSTPGTIHANGVLIETYENGGLTPIRLIADYLFARDKDGVWQGYWRHICITPFDDDRTVCLKMELWSTGDGDIENIRSFPNGCSFDLTVGTQFGRRTLQVIVKKDGIKNIVLASGLWHSEMTQTDLKKEWRSTEKAYFELPYSRIF